MFTRNESIQSVLALASGICSVHCAGECDCSELVVEVLAALDVTKEEVEEVRNTKAP